MGGTTIQLLKNGTYQITESFAQETISKEETFTQNGNQIIFKRYKKYPDLSLIFCDSHSVYSLILS